SEEKLACVRPVNSHMAARALPVSRISQVVIGGWLLHARIEFRTEGSVRALPVVTFETQGKHHRTPQQARVHRSVRRMAGLAPFDAHGSVLVNEGSALVDVALKTGFFVRLMLLDHARPRPSFPGRIESPVRVVTVGALYHAFIHAMFERHRKLGPR